MPLTEVQRQVVEEAQAAGLDPSFALAVAERESDFNPSAKASKTIRGIFQMSGPLREKYGHGDSLDPRVQTRAFAAYIKDLKSDLEKRLGRAPTDRETYLGHHFGPGRAARLAAGQVAPQTPTNQLFTPIEMAANPHFARAGTAGALTNSIYSDMGTRQSKFARSLNAQQSEPNSPPPMPSAGPGLPDVLPAATKATAQPPPLAETTSLTDVLPAKPATASARQKPAATEQAALDLGQFGTEA